MSIILGVFEEGLIYAIMALGVYITYTILDFPDLSVDSTFPMGAAITAALILADVPPFLTLFLAFLLGAAAGCVTGLIHVKLKVRDLLSGIIVMTALYSLNLRIAGNRSNLPFSRRETIFDNQFLSGIVPEGMERYAVVFILVLIVLVVKVLLDMYLRTRSGYLLRAAGDNEVLVTSLAKDKGTVKIIGLAIANGLAALAGCVYSQQQGFFELSTGTGTIVIGLANVIIGTKLFRRVKFIKPTTAVVLGAILYKACISVAIALGLASTDLKFIIAAIFLIILVLSNNTRKKGQVQHD